MSRLYTPEDALERLHPKLVALIEHQKLVCGCAMKAVRAVAQRVGTSEQWVRRITGRYGRVKVQAHQFINVAREHIRMKRRRKRTNASEGFPAEASRVRPWKPGGIDRRDTSQEASPVLPPVETGSGLPRP